MSIEENISNDANSSSEEVKVRAREEIDEGIRKKKLKNDGIEQDNAERKTYANLVFTLITMWLTMTLIVFIAIGQGKLHYSDTVIITLLTTTTANVIALFSIVMKYLFGAPSNK